MTNPFADLASPEDQKKNPFIDIAAPSPEIMAKAEQLAATMAPASTHVESPAPLIPSMPPTPVLGPPPVAGQKVVDSIESFDAFLEHSRKLRTGEIPTIPYEVEHFIKPISAFEYSKTGQELINFVRAFSSHTISNTMVGLVTLPFTTGYDAGKEIQLSGGFGSAMQEAAELEFGKMDPDQADEARRGFAAFMMSLAVPEMLVTRVAGTTSLAGAVVRGAAPAYGSRAIAAGAGRALGRTGRGLLLGQAEGVAGGAAFGAFSAPPEERTARAIAFGVAAAPFGLTIAALKMAGRATPAITDAATADLLAQGRTARPFDITEPLNKGPMAPYDPRSTAIKDEPLRVARLSDADLRREHRITQGLVKGSVENDMGAHRAPGPMTEVSSLEFDRLLTKFNLLDKELVSRNLTEEVFPGYVAPESIQPSPVPVVPSDVPNSVNGPLAAPASAPAMAAKMDALIKADGDLAAAIIHDFKSLPEAGMMLIPGVEKPGKALGIARSVIGDRANALNGQVDVTVAVHQRADGAYNIAIGKPGSLLELHKEQFVREGFIVGQEVSVNGKTYRYAMANKDQAVVLDIGTGKPLTVPKTQIRHASGITEAQLVPEEIQKQLATVLDADELSLFNSLVKKHLDAPVQNVTTTQKASSNGMYLDRSHAGGFVVRDTKTGEQLFRTPYEAEAAAFIDRSGVAQTTSFDFGGPPPDVPGSVMPATEQGPGPNQPNDIPALGGLTKVFAAMGATIPWFTRMRDWFVDVDNVLGTRLLGEVYTPTQDALMKMDNRSRPHLTKLVDIYKKYGEKMSGEERIEVSRARQAFSAADIIAGRASFFKNRKVSPQEVNAAKLLAEDLQVDTQKIYRYRRNLQGVIEARAKEEGIPVQQLPPEIRGEETAELNRNMSMTPNDLRAAELFNIIVQQDLDQVSLYAVSKLADALLDKTPSRAEYMNKMKFTPEQRQAVRALDDFYGDAELIKDLELKDQQLVEGYLNHYRAQAAHGATSSESAFAWQKRIMKGDIPAERSFISDMIRSGELNWYDEDPFNAAMRYVRAGFASRDFLPTWNSALRSVQDQLSKMGPKGEKPFMVARSYLSEMRGIPPASVQFTQEITDALLDSFQVQASVDVRKNITNTILYTSSGAALGFRMAQGVRDFTDFSVKYSSRFGYKRFGNAVRKGFEPGAYKWLAEKGLVTSISPVEFATPADLARSPLWRNLGQFPDHLKKFADLGLTVSLQKHFYEVAQAAAYLDTREVVLAEMSKFVKQEIPKAQFYKNVKLFTYDRPSQLEFDKIVNSGDVERAADYLGKETYREVLGVFGMANHPYGWGTNTGKLAGQFGNWPVHSRSFYLRGISQGTAGDRLGFATRFAMSQAAIKGASVVSGFNLYSWYALPGLVFTGGPAIQTGLLAAQLASPFDTDRAIAKSRLQRMLPLMGEGPTSVGSLFIPGSYAVNDIIKAFQQAENPIEFLGRATGIPLSQDRSWLDEIF